jgi:hypothetical protein
MLEALGREVDATKLKDIRRRLEHRDVKQALPAEMELGILWGLSLLGKLEVEPEGFGRSRPDASSEHLFPGHRCAIEITALSDARLSQEDDMRRIATRICEAANRIRKGQGRHLHFDFAEESGYEGGHPVRSRRIDPAFVLSEAGHARLRAWLAAGGDRRPLELVDGSTHVVVSWHSTPPHPHSNFFSSMPPEAYSLRDNPLHDRLVEKARQLASPSFEGLRCVLLADTGSRMLRVLEEGMRSPGTVNGREVIESFLADAGCGVDAVLVFSPYRNSRFFPPPEEPLIWRVSLFVRPGLQLSAEGVERLRQALPRPRFEGYQARSLQQQGAYRPDARGWHVATRIFSGRSGMTIKVSARALLDLLAGRITIDQFHHFTGTNSDNIFAHRLAQGDTLSSARIEPGGLDEDDDWIVFELQPDPSAGPLRAGEP